MVIFNIILSIQQESKTSKPLWIHYKHDETALSHIFEHDQIIEHLRKTPILVLKQFILYKLTVLTPINKYPDIFLILKFFTSQFSSYPDSNQLSVQQLFRPNIWDAISKNGLDRRNLKSRTGQFLKIEFLNSCFY